jgi:hypothetical protein
MSAIVRRLPGVVWNVIAGLMLANRALGAMILEAEETDPLLPVNKLADPQLELAGAIMILFAGSLAILLVGYVSDATRVIDRP